MKRFGALLVAMLLAGLIGAAPAFAQDNGFEGPYVEPGVVVRPTPAPPAVAPTPAPPVDVGAAPVVEVLPREVAQPVARALPRTGLDMTVGALLAMSLLLAGGGALYAARRKAAGARAATAA